MKVNCGVDIIEIDRIKHSIEESEQKFIDRVFTKNEIQYCESKKSQKYQHYAGRFVAKEAIFKAISKSIKDKYSVNWKDFEITNDEQGRPKVNFLGIISKDIEDIDISISHCKEYAIANVVVMYK